jgi:ATP-binding protein involved in chromosome partitioning
MAKELTQEAALGALAKVKEPATGKDIVALNAVRDLQIKGADANLKLVMVTPAYPFADKLEKDVRGALERAGAGKVNITWGA